MKLSSNYDLISASPNPGGHAALWISDVLAQEAATAIDAGTGATTPDSNGTPAAGTIVPGQIVYLNTSGYWDLATSPQYGTGQAASICMGVVHGGDEDYDGAYLGKLIVLCGIFECVTDQFTGSSFSPGQPLVASSGLFAVHTTADFYQLVGYVGNRGLNNGKLHVMFGLK